MDGYSDAVTQGCTPPLSSHGSCKPIDEYPYCTKRPCNLTPMCCTSWLETDRIKIHYALSNNPPPPFFMKIELKLFNLGPWSQTVAQTAVLIFCFRLPCDTIDFLTALTLHQFEALIDCVHSNEWCTLYFWLMVCTGKLALLGTSRSHLTIGPTSYSALL